LEGMVVNADEVSSLVMIAFAKPCPYWYQLDS
jgi:hypothetical protein